MIFINKLRSLLLLVIISCFCYRAVHLEQQLCEQEITQEQTAADYAFYTFLMMLCQDSCLNNTTAQHIITHIPASAASKEHIAEKLNTLIEGYAGTIARQSEKSCPNEKILTKIERELVMIEQAAQEHCAQNLLKNDIILEIRKSISLLRMLKRNK
jgi:hypothetical protein